MTQDLKYNDQGGNAMSAFTTNADNKRGNKQVQEINRDVSGGRDPINIQDFDMYSSRDGVTVDQTAEDIQMFTNVQVETDNDDKQGDNSDLPPTAHDQTARFQNTLMLEKDFNNMVEGNREHLQTDRSKQLSQTNSV